MLFLNVLHELNIDPYLHQNHVDKSKPAGKALFQVPGVFAEFELSIIRRRVNADLERARANGKRLGWPKVGEDVEKAFREAL